MGLNLLLIQILPENPRSSLKVTAVIIPLYGSQIKLPSNPGVVSCRNSSNNKLFKYFSAQMKGFWSPRFMTPFWLSAGYHSSLSLLPCVGKIGRPKASLEPYICTKLITINCNSRTVYFRQQYPMYKGHTFFFFSTR